MALPNHQTSAPLVDCVFEDDSQYRDLLRLAIGTLERDSPAGMYVVVAQIVEEAIGRDPVKLFALLDVIHEAIIGSQTWASTVAVNFYM